MSTLLRFSYLHGRLNAFDRALRLNRSGYGCRNLANLALHHSNRRKSMSCWRAGARRTFRKFHPTNLSSAVGCRSSDPGTTTQSRSTIIITGANGSLGSQIAFRIAEEQPRLHLVLTVRNPKSANVAEMSDSLRVLGTGSFEFAKLDLSSFKSMKDFARRTVQCIEARGMPPIQALVNCAAISSFVVDPPTEDGFDPVYQTNCLAPFMLTSELLHGFRRGNKADRPIVVNVGSSVISMGALDFFQTSKSQEVGALLGTVNGFKRYGSSKLLMNTAMYGLRRRLASDGHVPLNILTLDPGGMSNDGGLSMTLPVAIRFARTILSWIGPAVRLISKSVINDARVPATAIAKVAMGKSHPKATSQESYYILDEEFDLASVIPLTNDEETMKLIMQRVLKETGVILQEMKTSVTEA